jgi:hypothetical protein
MTGFLTRPRLMWLLAWLLAFVFSPFAVVFQMWDRVSPPDTGN